MMYQHDGTVDVFETIAALTLPLLVVRGGRTDRLPRATAADCTLVELPGRTHFAPMERPNEIAELARRFLLGEPVQE